MKIKLKGTFLFTVKREDGSIREELEFDNLITDVGMNAIAGPTGAGSIPVSQVATFNSVVLSTNTTPPLVSDTAMGGTTVSSVTGSPVYGAGSGQALASPTWGGLRHTGFKFNAGEATGTWSSVGLVLVAGTKLFCRTLIRAGGVPTSLTILASESLDIRYTLSIVPSLVDVSGSFLVNGTTINYVGRPSGLATSDMFNYANYALPYCGYSRGSLLAGASMALGPYSTSISSDPIDVPQTGVTGFFGTTGNYHPTITATAYVAGSFTRQLTYTWNNTQANASAIAKGCVINPGGPMIPYQFVFTPGIPKSATENLSLTLQVTWSR